MKTYRVVDIFGTFGFLLDEEVEAMDETEAKEYILNEILDDIGNYIDIDVEEVEEPEEIEYF